MLVPTRELAVQAAESVTRYARAPPHQHAGLRRVSIAAQVEALNAGVDILIATPGRLLDHLRQGR